LLSAPGVKKILVISGHLGPKLVDPLRAGAASGQGAVNVITLPHPVLRPPAVTVASSGPPGNVHHPLIVHLLQHSLRGTPVAVDDGHQLAVTSGHTIGQCNHQAWPNAWF
jgi:hypothetical protein